MLSADSSRSSLLRNFSVPLAKVTILLVISLGLFWFAEDFSPAAIFEPQSIGWILWMSYVKDLIQPFAIYFFLCLGENWLGTWRLKALLVFSVLTLLEIGQALYYQVASSHYVGAFDPLDILMYALSLGLAGILDVRVFPKLFRFWDRQKDVADA